MSKRNKINEFFIELKPGDDGYGTKKKCSLCDALIDKSSSSNLTRHVRAKHKKEFQEFEENQQANRVNLKRPTTSGAHELKLKQPKLAFPSQTLLQHCADLITTHGRPLTIFNDAAMQNIIAMIPGDQKIYSEKVKTFIQQQAADKRSAAIKFLNKKLLSLEFDFAENMGRSFFGIIARLYANDQPLTIVLDCKEVYERHTKFFISSEIQNCIKSYQILPEQLLSFVSDTARNMKAGVVQASIELEMEANEGLLEDIETPTINDALNDPIDFESASPEVQIDSETMTETYCGNLSENFPYIFDLDCASHVLQLAVNDFLKSKSLNSVLIHSQMIAVKLKNSTICALLKSQKLPRPILMHKVRWNWTFLNLDRLLQLQTFCKQNETIKSLKIPDSIWSTIKLLRDALEPVFHLSLSLQASNLAIPDMIFKWNSKKLLLKSLTSTFSRNLFKSIENRESQIFSKPIIIASMFLDKRFHDLLSNDEQNIAKMVIEKVQSRIEKLTRGEAELVSTQPLVDEGDSSLDEESELVERMLGSRTSGSVQTGSLEESTADALVVEIRKFSEMNRLRADTNIMLFWKKHKFTFPLLSNIALTILSIPVTEVDVERLFSNLSFIHTKLRNCLSDDMVSDILFLRMSSGLNFSCEPDEI